jgi:nucleoside-diphosphate-sugar epimerase
VRTLVVTGSSGRVASMTLPHLRGRFHFRGFDTAATRSSVVDEFVQLDVRDVDATAAALSDADAVLHFAAQPAEADFRELLLPRNLDATWAMYEAAVRAGVPRFVFASTLQTIQGHDRAATVPPNAEPRPISVYGCTKLFGEALGRYHADTSGIGVACLRLGAVREADSPDVPRSLWLGSRDLAALVASAVDSDIRFATVTAVSPPATEHFDTANPFGWVPSEHPVAEGPEHRPPWT